MITLSDKEYTKLGGDFSSDIRCNYCGEAVTVEMVIGNLMANVDTAKAIIKVALPRIADAGRHCQCGSALANAIITHSETIPMEKRETLKPLIGKYLS